MIAAVGIGLASYLKYRLDMDNILKQLEHGKTLLHIAIEDKV